MEPLEEYHRQREGSMSEKVKMKTVYVMKTRFSDEDHWSEPGYYRTRKERDRAAAMNRAYGGIRTMSYQEKKPVEEVEALFE